MYQIMWKNIPVLEFDKNTKTAKVLHPTMLPLGICNMTEDYAKVQSFCGDRILLSNRKYHKEILSGCKINNQSDVEICLAGKGLSFRDNYWIKESNSNMTWESINLYDNEFSKDIAYTALTGKIQPNINAGYCTGELTTHGTRAKCFLRREDGIYLAKAETREEIFSEILSNCIADNLGISHAVYSYGVVYGEEVSLCKINTSPQREIIPAREILKYTASTMSMDAPYYKYFMEHDSFRFLQMQLFDYLTLNTDRNRDNFALVKENGKVSGLYEMYDHDSCFKGKTVEAHYFVTGLSFEESIKRLYKRYPKEMNKMRSHIEYLYYTMGTKEEKERFIRMKDENTYESFMARVDHLLSFDKDNQ